MVTRAVVAAILVSCAAAAHAAPMASTSKGLQDAIRKIHELGVERPERREIRGGLIERQPLPKTPTDELRVPPPATGRLIVKFADAVKVRAMPDGSLASVGPNAAIATELDACNALLEMHGLSFVKAINHPDDVLAQLQARAAAVSGKAQPDLAGMLHVEDIPGHALVEVARTLNDLPCVEFVEFEVPFRAIDDPDGFGSHIQTSGPLVDLANETFGLDDSIIAMLTVPAMPAVDVTIQVPLMDGSDMVSLVLQPHSIRGEGFQFLAIQDDGSMSSVNVGSPRTVRGMIAGDPGSIVAGSILENGLYASIWKGDGSRYWVQPVAGVLEGGMPGQHAIYRHEDVIDNIGVCGTESPPEGANHGERPQGPLAGGDGPGTAAAVGGPCYTEITIELDSSWVGQFPSVSSSGFLAMAVINVVNAQYESQVNISHVVTAVIARMTPGSDPYLGNNNAITLIDQFQQEWNANFPVGIYRRDVAHLFTGQELQGAIIGIARDIGTICDTANSYSLSQRFGGLACQTDLVAHELGHNWNAVHCDCFSSSDPTMNFTMNPFLTCANQFSAGSITRIESYRDSRTCLDCGGPPPAGCGIVGNPCNTTSVNPYCSDLLCCGAVCAVMPECCDTAWDADCVALADSLCFDCGESGAGSCFSANFTPGCDDADCCAVVEAFEPLCASGLWDERCAILATLLCDTGDVVPTPDLKSFQAYLTEPSTPGFDIVSNLVLGIGYMGEGFDMDGLYDIGSELEDLGIGVNGARGRNVRVAAIEDAAYVDHEDLDVILEPGQTQWLNPEITSPGHGTAVLGIMNARDQTPAVGMVGMAPDAQAYFFPTFSLEEGGRLLSAITSALNTFGPGDVINFSIGPTNSSGGDCNIGVLTSSAANYTLIRLGSDLGITSVISAGNDCCNLDATPEAGADSGAIVVSSSFPGFPFCRIGFSNHSEEGEDIPHFSAYGAVVAAPGHNGDLFGPITDVNRQYTATFSGTSASAPMVAGIVACLQGLMKQFYGIPLMPEQVRGNTVGLCQCLTCNPEFLPTQEDGAECLGDTLDPMEEDVHQIGLIPLTVDWASTLLTSDFFGNPSHLEDIFVARGDHEFGNHFSVRSTDGNFLTVETEFTLGGQHPDAAVPPGVGINQDIVDSITYIVNGQVSDVLAAGRVPDANETDLGVSLVWQCNATHFLFIEAYDWSNGRFQLVEFQPTLPPDVLLGLDVVLPRAPRFVNPGTKQVIVRLWTFSFPNGDLGIGPASPNGGATNRIFWDQISITNDVEPGEVSPL